MKHLNIEITSLDWIQSVFQSSFLDEIMVRITMLGNGGILWIALTLLLLLFPKTRMAGWAMLAALAVEAAVCNGILKPLVGRARPFEVNHEIQLLIPPPLDPSFPSGHTGASFAAAFALFFKRNRLWIPLAILAVLMAGSRLYLYVHYPTDVLAGAFLGILSGWAGNRLTGMIHRGQA